MHPKKNSLNNAREQAYKSLLKIDREGGLFEFGNPADAFPFVI